MSIDERSEKEHSRARSIAKNGAVLLAVLSSPVLVILLTKVYGYRIIGITANVTGAYWLATILDTICSLAGLVLIILYLYHFSSGVSPYSQIEIRLLAISGIAFALSWVLEYIPGPTKDILVMARPITVAICAYDQPSLLRVILSVFLFCMTGVLRYARVLKEDSESIL